MKRHVEESEHQDHQKTRMKVHKKTHRRI